MKDKNIIESIRYTTLNGIMVPELGDIITYINEHGSTPPNMMTTDTAQEFNGTKTYVPLDETDEGGFAVKLYNHPDDLTYVNGGGFNIKRTDALAQMSISAISFREGYDMTAYSNAMIIKMVGATQYYLSIPSKHGTLAVTSDIVAQQQSDWNQTDTTKVDYIKNKPTFATLQTLYDAIYPVNHIYFGITAPAVPTGVTATWTLDTSYNGKYICIDTTKTAGSTANESITISGTSLGIDQIPWHEHDMEHYHNKGDMNIQGYFSIAPSMSGRTGDTLFLKKVSGAFYDAGGAGGATDRIEDIDAAYTRTANPQVVGFAAGRTGAWTGLTSQARDITNSFNIPVTGGVGAGDPHKHTGSAIKPATVYLKVWKRTA